VRESCDAGAGVEVGAGSGVASSAAAKPRINKESVMEPVGRKWMVGVKER
jgi:hypothetical protein